jgi:hypothetical protein
VPHGGDNLAIFSARSIAIARRAFRRRLPSASVFMAKSKTRQSARQKPAGDERNSRATVSGPAKPNASTSSSDDLAAKVAGTQELAASMPFNALNRSCDCVNQRGDNHG